MDIAGEHAAIEIVARIAADEISSHRANEALQQPDPGPFAHSIGECRTRSRHICHQHIVHIGAVIHDKDNGRVRINFAESFAIHKSKTNPVERCRKTFGQSGADAEISIGVKRRHYFAGIFPGLLHGHFTRHIMLPRMLLNSLEHLRIVEQIVC